MESVFAVKSKFDRKLLDVAARTDAFSGFADGHSRRIAELVGSIATGFNLASEDRFFLEQAALVRDIGALQMDRDYVSAVRTLTGDERIDMQRHPVLGEQATAKMGLSRGVQLIVRWHHEWWNGSGYADGIEGEQIPLAARILRVADTYSALISARPFRAALTPENARRYMIDWSGIEFDPAVIKSFLALPVSTNLATPA